MAGRALFGCLQMSDLVHEKVMQGSSKSVEYRAYRRIAPKSLELVIISQPVAKTFCGRLLLQYLTNAYFDPGTDWLKPIELNATLPIVFEKLVFLFFFLAFGRCRAEARSLQRATCLPR